MEAYLTKFQWEAARFPPRQSVPAIVDLISKVSRGYRMAECSRGKTFTVIHSITNLFRQIMALSIGNIKSTSMLRTTKVFQ